MRVLLASLLLCTIVSVPQNPTEYQSPPAQMPNAELMKGVKEKLAKLGSAIQSLRKQGVRDPYLADVEVFYKAAVWIERHAEWYHAKAGDWTLEILDRGLLRAAQLSQGEAPWLRQVGQCTVRGFRSRVDDSIQPYAVTFPLDYGRDPNKKWRVDLVLHGRDKTLTEVKFLQSHADRMAAKELAGVQIEAYGRGNNAYRWAGETDVIEVMDHFLSGEQLAGRGHLPDPSRVVLRGFSMGGAGAWHLGLHSPSRWCLVGPGAGFSTTRGYLKTLPAKLPEAQEACLHIYDAVDYAENAFNVPVVAYGGDRDPQLQAARNIEERLKPLGIPMRLLVAPGLAHQFPPEWQKKAEEAYAPILAKGKPEYPPHVRFVTYTLRYAECFWVEILALDRHYVKSSVDAKVSEAGMTVKTANVRQLRLALPADAPNPFELTIDQEKLNPKPWMHRDGSTQLYLERTEAGWKAVAPTKLATDRVRQPCKSRGLQGPIDDAFMDRFLCVRGTGEPWNERASDLASEQLSQLLKEWDKHLRGHLIVKDDVSVTEEDMASCHLILFGDPGSNTLIAQGLSALPFGWDKAKLHWAGKSYEAKDHLPVLVYPSPFNPSRYVVLNSGHTFHASDFQGTNALLYPRLGDYAVLKAATGESGSKQVEVVESGLFDDAWKLPSRP